MKSDFEGSDFHKFECCINDIEVSSKYHVLKRKHSPGKDDTLSSFILSQCGFDKSKVRTNADGKTRELSLRDLRILNLVDEIRVLTKISPFLTDKYVSKTVEQSVLKFLLTGYDDSKIIETIPPKILANKKGRMEMLDELIGTAKNNINQKNDKIELSDQLLKKEQHLSDTIAKREKIINNIAELSLEKKRIILDHKNSEIRLNEITMLLENSSVLEKQYLSDKKRLSSTIETSIALTETELNKCPICFSTIEGTTSYDLTAIKVSSETELSKIDQLIQELKKVQSNFSNEIKILKEKIAYFEGEINKLDIKIKSNFRNEIDEINACISKMASEKYELVALIKEFERIEYLEIQKKSIEDIIENAPPPKRSFESVDVGLMHLISKKMEELLISWGYPGITDVSFSEEDFDFVLSGEKRKLAGKGYRAITFASFLLSFNLITKDKEKKLGFSIIDSPLVTYKKPDVPEGEGITEDMAKQFYITLQDIDEATQFIVIENEDFPKDLESKVNHTHFTKSHNVGRYGFIPI